MTTETRSLIKVIPFWLILLASLFLTLWSVKQLASAIVTTATKSETIGIMGMKGAEMGMGGYGPAGYGNYCLIPPMYPPLSSSMGPGAVMTQEDKIALEKYNKEMERYNADYSAACRADMERQQKLQEEDRRSLQTDAITVYAILSFIGLFASAMSVNSIKKIEKEV